MKFLIILGILFCSMVEVIAQTTVGFTGPSQTVNEADGTFTTCLELVSGFATSQLTVNLVSISGAATGGDYDPTSIPPSVIFPAGRGVGSQACFTGVIINDNLLEGQEYFTIIASVSPEVGITQQMTVIYIVDDDEGLWGPLGAEGQKGTQGSPGTKGEEGSPGAPGPAGPRNGGVVYTRWGKATCRSGADLLYAGVMGGSRHTRAGGGTTRLCMPSDPEYTLSYIPGIQSYSPLYQVEYQETIRFSGHDIVCAVCVVTTNEQLLMIPAKTSCPTSWTREYYGYLMSERVHSVHHRSTFECVDKDLDSVPESGWFYQEHGFFGHVEAVCNHAMPCPPYNDYKEINCVVCTK